MHWQSTAYSPFPKRRDSKWSSDRKTESKSESRNYRSRSLFTILNGKRPDFVLLPMTISGLVCSGTGCNSFHLREHFCTHHKDAQLRAHAP